MSSLDNDGVDRQSYESPNCGNTKPHDQHFHSPIGGLTLNCPGAAEASDDRNLREHNAGQEWQELNELADRLYHFMAGAVGQVMLAAGEDPRDKALFRVRCAQVAYEVNSKAEQARKETA